MRPSVEGARDAVSRAPSRQTRSGRQDQRGAVTAETMMVLPLLVALTWALAWLVSLAATQVRVVDAAREVARALARDDPRAEALAAGRRAAPAGASFVVTEGGGEVRVRVVVRVRGPGGLLSALPGVEVDSVAVTAAETP